MFNWEKIHNKKKIGEAYIIIEEEGSEGEQVSFRCATYLDAMGEDVSLLFLAAMNFTEIKKAIFGIDISSVSRVAQYLANSIDDKNLLDLETLLVSLLRAKDEING